MAKVDDIKDYTQMIKKPKSLNEKKKTYRSKAIFYWKEPKKPELLVKKFRQEHVTANTLLTAAKKTLQKFQHKLQRNNRSREEAWKNASELHTELEAIKQQFNSLNSQFHQKVSNLQVKTKPHVISDNVLKHAQTEKNIKIRKALDATLRKIKIKDITIRKLKKQKKFLLKEKKYLKKKIYQQAKMHQVREAKHNINLESKRKKIDSLKHENAKLRELQMETNRKLSTHNGRIVKQLHKTILTMQLRLNKTENLAKDTNRLERERQTQESAIEILRNDFDTLNKENTLLIQERDRLIKELRELKVQNFFTSDIRETYHKKAGLSLKMLQL